MQKIGAGFHEGAPAGAPVKTMIALDHHPSGRHFLQIPGPSPVPDRILRAMSLPTIDHRGPEFATLGLKVIDGLKQVFRTQHPVAVSGVRAAVALADPAGLEQLLGHLVQNAIDASPPTEPVTLGIAADGMQVVIDVIDKGCGMSPAFVRDKLFKPFVSSKAGGFGIGAFEAQQLAAAMQARIEVVSREGKGGGKKKPQQKM